MSSSQITGIFVVIIIVLAVIFPKIIRHFRQEKLIKQPISDAWRDILKKRVPLYSKLPLKLQQQLEGNINIFLAEKEFFGCQGVEINDDIRVTVAAQACMLIMNKDSSYYKDLYSIYIYPSAYICKQKEHGAAGIVVESEGVNLGESWSNGKIVLSWESTVSGAAILRDGHNVVMHEFAHQLDTESGDTDGCPILGDNVNFSSWSTVLGGEYNELLEKTEQHKKSVIDKYGATNHAEFFAVATETFFEKPVRLKKTHPELYEQLQNYYQLNPIEWYTSG